MCTWARSGDKSCMIREPRRWTVTAHGIRGSQILRCRNEHLVEGIAVRWQAVSPPLRIANWVEGSVPCQQTCQRKVQFSDNECISLANEPQRLSGRRDLDSVALP